MRVAASVKASQPAVAARKSSNGSQCFLLRRITSISVLLNGCILATKRYFQGLRANQNFNLLNQIQCHAEVRPRSIKQPKLDTACQTGTPATDSRESVPFTSASTWRKY